jgi:NTE family protein
MIETLVIRPSEPIAEIAAAHADELPRVMRWMMNRAGVLEPNGARVLSYLLFERGYCRHLMRLGFSDAMAQRGRILNFLGYGSPLPELREGRQGTRAVEMGAA